MSDNWLQFVSCDPHFRPSPDAAARAIALLEEFLPFAEEITSEFTDAIEFFHPGANWQGVCGPA